MQLAVQEDADVLRQLAREEKVAKDDHDMSVALSAGKKMASAPSRNDPVEDEELLKQMARIYVAGLQNNEDHLGMGGAQEHFPDGQAESSTWASSWPRESKQQSECIACGEMSDYVHVARAPCTHEYCRDCLQRLFEESMLDETLFPPRCCKVPIPLEQNILLLPQAMVDRFREKSVEFSTPNRTYCHQNGCSAFVPSGNCIDGVAKCQNCTATTCTVYKGASHAGDCPYDEQLQEVITMARSEGWRRCQNCWAMIELNIGCNHIT
jgi:hypothetical protein